MAHFWKPETNGLDAGVQILRQRVFYARQRYLAFIVYTTKLWKACVWDSKFTNWGNGKQSTNGKESSKKNSPYSFIPAVIAASHAPLTTALLQRSSLVTSQRFTLFVKWISIACASGLTVRMRKVSKSMIPWEWMCFAYILLYAKTTITRILSFTMVEQCLIAQLAENSPFYLSIGSFPTQYLLCKPRLSERKRTTLLQWSWNTNE